MKKTLTGLFVLYCSLVFSQNAHIDTSRVKETRLVTVYTLDGVEEKNMFYGLVDTDSMGRGPSLSFADPSGKITAILKTQGSDTQAFRRWASLGYDTFEKRWIVLKTYYAND